MNFGKRLREYREGLNISQTEAAYRIGEVPNTYSNYERGDRPIPSNLLPVIKETFNIPDDQFLDMLLDRPRNKKQSVETLAIQTKELRERYLVNFADSYFDLIQKSSELRQIIALVSILDVKNRRQLLNSLKSILIVFEDLLVKHGINPDGTPYGDLTKSEDYNKE